MATTTRSFAGAGVALITPFKKDESLDEAALRRLVKRQIDGGIDVLVPCGTTGESVTLDAREHDRVIEIALEESGGRPVLAGAGSNDTRTAVEKTRRACALGAHGILSVGPYYNKPTPDGFVRHFSAVADASTAPVVIYNVPGRTGSNIDNKTLLKLAGHGNIKGVKEASGNIVQILEILRDRPSGFEVLSGDDAFTLAVMAGGGEGVISVCANQIPREMHELTAACAKGDFAAARKLHLRLLSLMNLNFVESNPVPVKSSLAMLGLCEDVFRSPLAPAAAKTRELVKEALDQLGVKR
jgi:4-hydroxy-tetrahydrodipicolinate synthase